MPKEDLHPIVPLFRSDGQAALLASLYMEEGRELSLTELAADAGLSIGKVHEEVERLEKAGLLRSRRVGRSRLVSVNPDSLIAEDVGRLVQKLLGVEVQLERALGPIPGVEAVTVFGSWAARRQGVEGPAPEDIDVLVIGEVDLDSIYGACARLEARVGLPVNPTVFTGAEWDADASGFARSVREGPSIRIVDRAADDSG